MTPVIAEAARNTRSVMESKKEVQHLKIVVFVPETHADAVRKAMGKAGAGKIGNYSFCSFSLKGIGRFRPEEGSEPVIGEIGRMEEVIEERIEMVCRRDDVNTIIDAVRDVHPYEEVPIDLYPIEVT